MPTNTSHYHVGIVVTDIAAAQARLSAMLGVTWGPVMRLDAVDYRDGAGNDVALPTTMCYSVGDPCLELIEEVPGSVWVRNAHSNLHHIGYWSDRWSATAPACRAGAARSSSAAGPVLRPLCPLPITATRCSGCASNSSTRPCATAWRSCSSPTPADPVPEPGRFRVTCPASRPCRTRRPTRLGAPGSR